MALPPRAAAFIDRLGEFLEHRSMRKFLEEALGHYFRPGDSADTDTQRAAQAYAIYLYRDSKGQTGVDRFLRAHGATLPAEERQVFERMRASTFGFFEVESLERGRGMRLRRVGTDERFDIVEVGATQSLRVGWGIFVCLVPYQDHYELVGSVLTYPQELVYSIERTIRRNPDVVLSDLSDPLWVRKNIDKLRNKPAPPENKLEAELVAEQVFADFGLDWRVEELQARFQTMTSFLPLLHEIPPRKLRGREDVDRLTRVLGDLWNLTPRDELDGLSPEEKAREGEEEGRLSLPPHLAMDLMQTVAREVNLDELPDDEARRRAVDAVTERWRHEPQEALGGLTPDEFVEGRKPLRRLDPEDLPAPDRPLWTPASRLATFQELLEANRFEGALHVACRMARSNDPIPVDLFGRFLDSVDGEVLRRFWTEGCEHVPEAAKKALAALAVERIDLFRDAEALGPVVRFLARCADPQHEELLNTLIEVEGDTDASDAAVEGLIRLRTSATDDLLLLVLESCESQEQATETVALGLVYGSLDAIPLVVEAFLDRVADDSEGSAFSSPIGELPFELEEIGLGSELSFRVACSSVAFGSSDEEAPEGPPFSAFFPVEDPAAARRAAQVVTAERKARLGELGRQEDNFPFIKLLAELVGEAVELACRDNPEFEELGERLRAFASAVVDPERVRALSQDDREELSVLMGSVLAKAIRGHDFRVEAPAALADPAKLRELLRVDEEWLHQDLVVHATSLLSEDDLLPIADSEDDYVIANALSLLAALDPQKYALRAVEELDGLTLPTDERLGWSARVAGDAFLDAIHDGLSAKRWRGWEADLCSWLPIVATERAREFFRADLDAFLEAIHTDLGVEDLVDAACVLADRDLALQVARALETSGVALGEIGTDRARLRYLLQALFDLTGVSEDVEAVLDRVAAASIGRDPGDGPAGLYDAEEGRDEDYDEDIWDDDDRSSWFDGESPQRSILDSLSDEPFRRPAPKVGRNDPCPCGSGKKYKRCCGKGE